MNNAGREFYCLHDHNSVKTVVGHTSKFNTNCLWMESCRDFFSAFCNFYFFFCEILITSVIIEDLINFFPTGLFNKLVCLKF
jgi:hypothetical protein